MQAPFKLLHARDEGGDALRQEVVAFWQANAAIPADQIEQRSRQLVIVAKDASGAIAGVSTAYNAAHPQLEHSMFHLRMFVAPAARRLGLSVAMTEAAKTWLERHNAQLPKNEKALGIIAAVEAPAFQATTPFSRRAVMDTGFIFIGRTPDGAHLRVYFFKDAVLNFTADKPSAPP